MTLRKKTLFIIGIIIASMAIIVYVASQHILLGSFEELEAQNALQNVERALNALADQLLALDSTTYDWAAWDATYAFVEDLNQAYIASNVLDSTFTGLQVNFILFIDNDGQIVFGRGFDLEKEEEIPLSASLCQYLADTIVLRQHANTSSHVTGIVPMPENPLLVASRPILTSEDEGPMRGSLVMARYLDTREMQSLAEETFLSLTTYRFNDPQMPADVQQARTLLTGGERIVVQPLNAETIAGYTLLNDIEGQAILILRVDLPRHIWNQSRTSLAYFITLLSVAGLGFGVIALLLLEKLAWFKECASEHKAPLQIDRELSHRPNKRKRPIASKGSDV